VKKKFHASTLLEAINSFWVKSIVIARRFLSRFSGLRTAEPKQSRDFRKIASLGNARNDCTNQSSTSIKRMLGAAACFLLVLPAAQVHAQATIRQILQNGATGSRLNIVMLSEGYTSQQLPGFVNDATTTLNTLLNTPPFKEYRSYFNAFAISVASKEPGSDHPASGVFRDTYFNSSFDSFGIQKLLTIPPNDRDANYANGRGKVDSLLQLLMPEYDIVIMVVNDPQFGGSGGVPAIASIHPGGPEIVVHELGHSFAGLGDEYSTPFPGYPEDEEPNTTRETRRDHIKWRSWISDDTPIPTPPVASQYGAAIGLFEGAHYHAAGWFRPKVNCKMRTHGAAFCEVCMETLIKSQYEVISPIESFAPPAKAVALNAGESASFAVVPMKPATHDLSIQWYVDGKPVSNATSPEFRVFAEDLDPGAHQVKVKVFDSTMLVRNDPLRLLSDSTSWVINGSVTEDDHPRGIPAQYSLEQNYPNPFWSAATFPAFGGGNPETAIRFALPEAGNVTVKIFNTTGQEIRTLANASFQAGYQTLRWDGRDQSGNAVAAGVYLYQITATGANGEVKFSATKRMAFVK